MKQITPRNLFLLDGIGALVSAIMLGVVLVQFESFFGMPASVLQYLALAAGIFAVYSFSQYVRFPQNWIPYLRFIATVNLLYCAVTLALVLFLYGQLTYWGILYFVGEIILVVTLAVFELRTAKR
ncbi:MAG: hypothetical protein AAFW00_20585 [Bacteroidota bacterium]